MIRYFLGMMTAAAQGRSPHWPAVRAQYLKWQPGCAVCGAKGGNDVHHIVPFHVDPGLELDLTNLVSLCRPHHLLVGHLMDWSSWNEACLADAAAWRKRIAGRPKETAEDKGT